MADLSIKALNIGEFFFSGSQAVFKGEEVAWILDETFAFKTTEECAVSANYTPFVNLSAGQTFIIKKSMPYIFDRDTVVGLAYPQENIQDIIIENDIYNNNMSTINIEANSAPTVSAGVNQIITIGDEVTIYSTAVPVSPATISSYSWLINGSQVGTTANYTFTPSATGDIELTLIVTDSDGRKAYDSVIVTVEALPVLDDITMSTTFKYDFGLINTSWRRIGALVADEAGTGTVTVTGSVPIWTLGTDEKHDVNVRILQNSTVVATGTADIPASNTGFIVTCSGVNSNTEVETGDDFHLEIQDEDGASNDTIKDNGNYFNEIQVVISDRTA